MSSNEATEVRPIIVFKRSTNNNSSVRTDLIKTDGVDTSTDVNTARTYAVDFGGL